MRRISTLMILSLLVFAFMAMSAFAASTPAPSKRVSSGLANKMVHYSFPDERNFIRTSSGQKPADQSLGLANPPGGSLSPGYKIGDTWYDYQHNGSMGRMIDWGYDATNGYVIHFTWMRMNSSAFAGRHFAYTTYFANSNIVQTPMSLQVSEYAGYCGIDVMDGDGGAVVGGHNNPGAGNKPYFYYETGAPGDGTFDFSYVSDPPLNDGTHAADQEPLWPKFRYQDVPGHTPVTHVLAAESSPTAADPQCISYFRKVGIGADGSWDVATSFVVDTSFDISQDVACSNISGKVALIWTANGCPNLAACDTCSNNDGSYAVWSVQWENDAYYKISYDYGATWSARVNMTKHNHEGDFWLPYTDMSCLIDSEDKLHIAYSAAKFGDEEGTWGNLTWNYKDCRIYHWSEDVGFETTSQADGLSRANVQLVADLSGTQDWAQEAECWAGGWNLMGSKLSVSECNGRLYILWAQFNDPEIGLFDDCANRAASDQEGSANGDLQLSVSSTLDGCLWDGRRNLTNSYTPNCDSVSGTNGRCDSDMWPSMARFGTNYATTLLDDSVIVDPSGSYTGGYYLPVMYVSDRDAGGIVQDEGTWQLADIAWFQLACVPPEPTRTVIASFRSINYPAWTGDGGTKCTTLTLQNIGNENATGITTSTSVTSGHPAGALTASHGSFNLAVGCSPAVQSGQICMGNGLISSAGGPQELIGAVTFTGTFDNSPLDIPIHFFVADTVYMQSWDTVYCDDGTKAAALALTVGNNGNYGDAGEGKVNLDYFEYGDCTWYDDEGGEDDDYLGERRWYLYDGSPIICWDDGGTKNANYSMFDVDFATTTGNVRGFFPMAEPPQEYPSWMTPNLPVDADMNVFEFVNLDTTIKIEQVTIAPNVAEPTYMIQAVKYTNLTSSAITGLAIGEGVDWDIPSDSGSQNRDGYDAGRHLIYQVGEEYGQDETSCLRNDARAGGLAVLRIFEDGVESSTAEYGLYTMDNATQVYPAGHFPPDSLWLHMQNKTGFTTADSSMYNDLHMVGTYRWNYTLPANGGNLIVYTIKTTTYSGGPSALSTSVDEATDWYELNFTAAGAWGRCCYEDQCSVERQVDCIAIPGSWTAGLDCSTPCPETCCRYVGDIKHDGVDGDPTTGIPLIDDLVYLVTYMFQNDQLCTEMCDDNPAEGCSGDQTATLPETNINGEGIDFPFIDDLVYLVTYMFQNGPEPVGWIDKYTPACNK